MKPVSCFSCFHTGHMRVLADAPVLSDLYSVLTGDFRVSDAPSYRRSRCLLALHSTSFPLPVRLFSGDDFKKGTRDSTYYLKPVCSSLGPLPGATEGRSASSVLRGRSQGSGTLQAATVRM